MLHFLEAGALGADAARGAIFLLVALVEEDLRRALSGMILRILPEERQATVDVSHLIKHLLDDCLRVAIDSVDLHGKVAFRGASLTFLLKLSLAHAALLSLELQILATDAQVRALLLLKQVIQEGVRYVDDFVVLGQQVLVELADFLHVGQLPVDVMVEALVDVLKHVGRELVLLPLILQEAESLEFLQAVGHFLAIHQLQLRVHDTAWQASKKIQNVHMRLRIRTLLEQLDAHSSRVLQRNHLVLHPILSSPATLTLVDFVNNRILAPFKTIVHVDEAVLTIIELHKLVAAG